MCSGGTFLTNQIDGIAAIDLFVLPTMTFRLLLLPGNSAPRASSMGIVWVDGKSDCKVDFAPDYRSVPLGQCTSLPHLGPGRCVWPGPSCSVCAPWAFGTGRS